MVHRNVLTIFLLDLAEVLHLLWRLVKNTSISNLHFMGKKAGRLSMERIREYKIDCLWKIARQGLVCIHMATKYQVNF